MARYHKYNPRRSSKRNWRLFMHRQECEYHLRNQDNRDAAILFRQQLVQLRRDEAQRRATPALQEEYQALLNLPRIPTDDEWMRLSELSDILNGVSNG